MHHLFTVGVVVVRVSRNLCVGHADCDDLIRCLWLGRRRPLNSKCSSGLLDGLQRLLFVNFDSFRRFRRTNIKIIRAVVVDGVGGVESEIGGDGEVCSKW